MDINTIFNAISLSSIYSSYGPPQQRDRESRRLRKFRAWLLRRDEQQRTEIARLQAELDGDDLMAGEAELFKPEYIKQLEAEFARLRAQVATLERIIEREAEKTTKAGQP